MASNYLMGFDIGGSNLRCLLQNVENEACFSALQPWGHTYASEYGHWALSLDTEVLWKILGDLARRVTKQARISPEEVVGIAVSSMRHSLVLMDELREVIFATPNTDARANSQLIDLVPHLGETFYQRTGHWPSPIFMPSRLMWLSHHQPEILKRARTAFCVSDWVNFRLTGEIVAERSQAAESMLLELETGAWAEDLISSLDLSRELFPSIAGAGSRLGSLTKDAAENLGLVPGIPVSLGGADTQSGLLGLGVIQPAQLAIIAGSTSPIQEVLERPIIDKNKRLWTGLHLIPDLYVLESNAGAMGSSLKRFAKMFYPEGTNPVGRLTALAAQAPVGAEGIFSSVGGTVFNASELVLPIETFSFSPFHSDLESETRAAFSRAILEGMAYAIKANIEQIEEVSQTEHEVVWMGGGMARSSSWRQIISDVLNCRVRFGMNSETTGLGAVICAGVGAGIYKDHAEGVEMLVIISDEQSPNADSVRLYSGHYEDWCALRDERKEADLLASNFMIESIADRQKIRSSSVKQNFKPKIYVSADLDGGSLDRLREIGEVTYASYREEDILLVGDELVETLSGYHVFITEVDILDAEALQQLDDLRIVFSCRGNPVNVDIPACTAAGVLVLNTPGRNAEAVVC
jgi:sugar (pentulose or hexulose) kinase